MNLVLELPVYCFHGLHPIRYTVFLELELQLLDFLNKSGKICPIKLILDMLYHMNKTFLTHHFIDVFPLVFKYSFKSFTYF